MGEGEVVSPKDTEDVLYTSPFAVILTIGTCGS
jgi:hypothetical protein